MINKNKWRIQSLREMYPRGCRVVLDSMDDMQAPPPGTQGTVTGVDDMGTIHVAWDTGCGLGICPDGGDSAHRIRTEEEYRETLNHYGKSQTAGARCPRCGLPMPGEPSRHALSRRAKIYICDDCGTAEALDDYFGRQTKLVDWALILDQKELT